MRRGQVLEVDGEKAVVQVNKQFYYIVFYIIPLLISCLNEPVNIGDRIVFTLFYIVDGALRARGRLKRTWMLSN